MSERSATRSAATRQRLIEATLAVLGDVGWAGVRTRAIAQRAEVSEVTVFRHFASKQQLLAEAVAVAAQPFASAIPEPTDDLVADLRNLARGYVAFVDAHPAVVSRLLPEIGSATEAAGLLGPGQLALAGRIVALFEHHQHHGRLATESVEDTVRAFVGPLLARAMLRHVLTPSDFEAAAHVERFLSGHGKVPNR